MKTVAEGQSFVTLDDAELAKLGGSCPIIQSITMDSWKHEDRSSIGGSSHHQGRYGIEIRVESLFGDGSHSCVMIVSGLNKYVTEVSGETQ